MAIATALTIATLAASAGGAALQAKGAKKQAKASRESIAAQKRGEAARLTQARLEHGRERRKTLRASIVARSNIISGATNRGISLGSSIVGGSTAQAAGEAATSQSDITQNLQNTEAVFQANEDAASAGDRFNQAGATIATGKSIGNFASTISSNFGAISRVGDTLAASPLDSEFPLFGLI